MFVAAGFILLKSVNTQNVHQKTDKPILAYSFDG